MPTDSKKRKSKVKARVVPNASSKVSPKSSPPVPPPTPVLVLQKIGTNTCGIPEEELAQDKLEQERMIDEDPEESEEDSA
jgi:hypothetical protein